jgi:hypothetical protein
VRPEGLGKFKNHLIGNRTRNSGYETENKIKSIRYEYIVAIDGTPKGY